MTHSTPDAVAQAHEADLKTQEKYGVKYLRYWFDENAGKVFCLIEAPNKEAAIAVHREAHGYRLPMRLLRSKRDRRRLSVTRQGQSEKTRLSLISELWHATTWNVVAA